MNKTFEKYAFNFNPRDGPKDIKLRYLMKIGVLKRISIPIGRYTQHLRYQTACRDDYIRYHECLEFNKFDRNICALQQTQVVKCEHDKGLYPKNNDVIERLKLGLEISKKRRQAYNRKLQQQYETRKYTKGDTRPNRKIEQVQPNRTQIQLDQMDELSSIPDFVDVDFSESNKDGQQND